MKILIQNGRVVDPASGPRRAGRRAIAGPHRRHRRGAADFDPNRVIDATAWSWRPAWSTWPRACASPATSTKACWKASWRRPPPAA
jgi:hypothetical protein